MSNYILGLGGKCCDSCTPDDACKAKPIISVCGSGSGTEGVYGTWPAFSSASYDAGSTWSLSGAPSGIAITSDTAFVYGTPTAAGTYNFTVIVTNACGSASCTFTLTVAAGCDFEAAEDAGGVPQTYYYDVTGSFIIEHGLTLTFGVGVAGQTPPINSWRIKVYADASLIYDSGCTMVAVVGATMTAPAGTTEISVELIDCAGDPEGNAVFLLRCE